MLSLRKGLRRVNGCGGSGSVVVGREQGEAGGTAEPQNPLQILYLLNMFVMLTLHDMAVGTYDIKMQEESGDR